MQKEPKKDKMIKQASDKAGAEIEFFFSGGTEYIPQTIKATTREEAEAKWLQTRKKVEQ
jgi:hypothetical protein